MSGLSPRQALSQILWLFLGVATLEVGSGGKGTVCALLKIVIHQKKLYGKKELCEIIPGELTWLFMQFPWVSLVPQRLSAVTVSTLDSGSSSLSWTARVFGRCIMMLLQPPDLKYLVCQYLTIISPVTRL